MDIKQTLLIERAKLDQMWAETREMFCLDADRMLRLWTLLSDHDFDALRALPEEDLDVIGALTMLAFSELLQQAGDQRLSG